MRALGIDLGGTKTALAVVAAQFLLIAALAALAPLAGRAPIRA